MRKRAKGYNFGNRWRRRRVVAFRIFLLAVTAAAVGAMWWFVILEPGQAVELGNGYTSHREFGWTGVEFQGFDQATVFVDDANGRGVYGPIHGHDIQYKTAAGGYEFTICRPASSKRVPVRLTVVANYHTVVVAPSGTHC